MRIREIERHLRIYLPELTSRFNSEIEVSSYVVNGGVATITTADAHGVELGDEVKIKGVTFLNPIQQAKKVSSTVALATTEYPNDLTFHPNGEAIDVKTSVEITGATTTDYNGTHNLTNVVDRRNFYFEIDPDAPEHAVGDLILHEEGLLALNGLFTVESVISATAFTIAVNKEDFTAPPGITFYNLANVRIASDITPENASRAYTRQSPGDYWIFIAPQDTRVSRDRRVQTDFDYSYQQGNDFYQETEDPFILFLFIPATKVYTPVDAMDEANNELKKAIFKCLLGYFPSKTLTGKYDGIFYTGSGVVGYDKSVYIHGFNFAATSAILSTDTYIPDSTAVHLINANHDINQNLT